MASPRFTKKFIKTVVIFNVLLIALIAVSFLERPDEISEDSPQLVMYGFVLEQGVADASCEGLLTPVRVYFPEKDFGTGGTATELMITDSVKALLTLPEAEVQKDFPAYTIRTAAYHPDLIVEGTEKNGEIANVFLSGELSFDSECSSQRFLEQLNATVTEFQDIETARFYLNGSEEELKGALGN